MDRGITHLLPQAFLYYKKEKGWGLIKHESETIDKGGLQEEREREQEESEGERKQTGL